MSIHAGRIAASADLRNRAAQTLVMFATPLLVSLLHSIPMQWAWLLGTELLVLAVTVGVVLIVLDRRADRAVRAVPLRARFNPSIRRPSPQSGWR
jgi:hypothetical protein